MIFVIHFSKQVHLPEISPAAQPAGYKKSGQEKLLTALSEPLKELLCLLTVAAVELINAAGCVDELHLTSVERV